MDPPGKNLWDLSAGAQTQLIQILNERYPDNGQFTGALNREYMVDGSGPIVDFTSSKLRMVFTISKKKDYTLSEKEEQVFAGRPDRIHEIQPGNTGRI